MRKNDRPALPALTSLRFFAALLVLLFHVVPPGRLREIPAPVSGWLKSGYEAVDLFFVLSGFVLYYVHSGVRTRHGMLVDLRRFIVARLIRVAPAFYLALAVSLPQFLYAIFVSGGYSAGSGTLALVAVPLFMQAWIPHLALAWNGPAWSLSVELFFYLAFPFVFSALERRPVRPVCGILVAISLVLLADLLRLVSLTWIDPRLLDVSNFVDYFPLLHLPTFLLGVVLARAFLSCRGIRPGTFATAFALACAVVLVVLGLRDALPAWATSRSLLVPLYGLVVFGAAGLQGRWLALMSSRWLLALGAASYSLYILHVPLFFWWEGLAKTFAPAKVGATGYSLAFVALAMLAALAVHEFLEKPVRRILSARWIHRS